MVVPESPSSGLAVEKTAADEVSSPRYNETTSEINKGTERAPRGTYPPYIHFTLQKTNRDTQDALLHISRLLRVNIKDLSVAGTKDKRGVTIQRVSLKRGNKTVEDVWKMANSIGGRRTLENALKQRGERGVRVADLNYRKASLELGMLKGNAFVITLRLSSVHSLIVLKI
jgi:tRNA pseudouridine13 synthase